MKRIICLAVALLLCASMAFPTFAAENEFVPSISYKDHPEVVPTPDGYIAMLCDDDGNPVSFLGDDCIVITPVSQAETSKDIPEDARETLLEVYKALSDGSMKIPYEDDTDWVVRDLFDISLLCEDHPKMMAEGAKLVITFDLGVGAYTDVNVMVYSDGEWHPAVSVVNNGDGTVTITLDRVGVVAFSVPVSSHSEPPRTGDVEGSGLALWLGLMVVSAGALVTMVIGRRKFVQ